MKKSVPAGFILALQYKLLVETLEDHRRLMMFCNSACADFRTFKPFQAFTIEMSSSDDVV